MTDEITVHDHTPTTHACSSEQGRRCDVCFALMKPDAVLAIPDFDNFTDEEFAKFLVWLHNNTIQIEAARKPSPSGIKTVHPGGYTAQFEK